MNNALKNAVRAGGCLASTVVNAQDTPFNQRIVFTSQRDGNFELYSMAADGSDLARLTTARGDDYAAAWSPDQDENRVCGGANKLRMGINCF